MANILFPKFKQALLSPGVNLATAAVKAVLIDSADYTYSSAHDNLDDVPAGARVGTPTALANKTFVDGTFDADDVTLSSVTGDPSEVVLLFIDTGVESTSTLIAIIDTATGLPVTPGGGPILISWNAGGILSL